MRLLSVICSALLLATSCMHASPLPVEHDVKVFSPNHRFFVVSLVKEKHTLGYRTGQPSQPLWDLPFYTALPSLANDGYHLATAYAHGNILDHDVRSTDPLITFYTPSGKHVLTVQDVVGDFHRFGESSDGWGWGRVRDFDKSGWLVVDLDGGQTLRFNPDDPRPARP